MLPASTGCDPCRDRLCQLEAGIDQQEAEARANRFDRQGYVAGGMRLWKRGRLQAFLGAQKTLIFRDDPMQAANLEHKTDHKLRIWAAKAPATLPCLREAHGFLRSRGLGANLVPPRSLVTDALGIYYDPSRESRLDQLIRNPLPADGAAWTEKLRKSLIAACNSKYKMTANGADPDLPPVVQYGQKTDVAAVLICRDASFNPLPDVPPGFTISLPTYLSPKLLIPAQAASDASRQIGTGGAPRYGSTTSPPGHRILVPRQVEDDASIRHGTTNIGTNLALLQPTRAANQGAIIIYKPRPDGEADLHPGAIPPPA